MEATKQNVAKKQYPLSENSLTVSLQGLFGLPEEWKTLEENNPNFFVYSASFLSIPAFPAKYQSKQPSLYEQRVKLEEEEAARAKKGAKKGGKEEDSELQDKIKLLKEQEEAEAEQHQKEQETLDEHQIKYRFFEEPSKSAQIKFSES
jgi:hypothetical protein